MKNIWKKFLIIFMTFSIILSINIVSRAENEVTENNLEPSETEQNKTVEENSSLEKNAQNEKNFFSLSSNDVTVSDDVIGDVFICTSGTAIIDAVVTGNVFICATNIEISENAQIESSLFSASENLNILGSIDGNVYSISQDFTLAPTAYIDLDLFLISQDVNIHGCIYRNANISSEKITFSEDAYIQGDLNYSSKTEIDIPEGIVYGNINYQIDTITPNEIHENKLTQWIYSTLSYIIVVIILFFICKWMHCKFIYSHQDFTHNVLKYFLYGILGLVALPIISVLLLILGITAPLAFVLLAIYFVFLLIASASLLITLSLLFAEKLKEKLSINDTARTILLLITLCIIYKLLLLIPTIGFILSLLFGIVGFGLLVRSTFKTKEQN